MAVKRMNEYFCPNCEAVLNHQPGFDPGKGHWVCTKCGMPLYGDDVYDGEKYPGVMWYCDGCHALLNAQSGFSDFFSIWTCTECLHANDIHQSEILGEIPKK